MISREYSSEWKPGDEPYYPVNDERNSSLYASILQGAGGQGRKGDLWWPPGRVQVLRHGPGDCGGTGESGRVGVKEDFLVPLLW